MFTYYVAEHTLTKRNCKKQHLREKTVVVWTTRGFILWFYFFCSNYFTQNEEMVFCRDLAPFKKSSPAMRIKTSITFHLQTCLYNRSEGGFPPHLACSNRSQTLQVKKTLSTKVPYLMVNAPSAKYGYLLYPETARFKCHSAHHSSSVSSPSWN